MNKKLSLAGLILAVVLINQQPASAVDRYISVTANGTVKVKPDSVRINATAWATASSSKLALNQTSTASEKLRNTLNSTGITKEYIKSNSISVMPEYNYTPDKGSVLLDYKATQSFEIIVRNAGAAGNLVDAIVSQLSESITIDGVTPFIYDPTKATASARIDAVKRAKSKASSYAKLLGVHLGKIIYLDESNGSSPIPLTMATAKSDSGATVVDLGTQDVIVSVTTRWAIY